MHPEHSGDEGLDRCLGSQLDRTLADGLPRPVLGEVLPAGSFFLSFLKERRVDGGYRLVLDGRSRQPGIVGRCLVRFRGGDVLRSPACDELVEFWSKLGWVDRDLARLEIDATDLRSSGVGDVEHVVGVDALALGDELHRRDRICRRHRRDVV